MKYQDYERGISLHTTIFLFVQYSITVYNINLCGIYVLLLTAFTVLTDREAALKNSEKCLAF